MNCNARILSFFYICTSKTSKIKNSILTNIGYD